MRSERKTNRQIQLRKQIDALKDENAKLQDCILLQQKIIQKQIKQKQIFDQEGREHVQQSYCLKLSNKSKKKYGQFGRSQILLKSLISQDNLESTNIQCFKNQKLCSTKNNSIKTTQSLVNESLKKRKQIPKLLTINDLNTFNTVTLSSSSDNLFVAPKSTISIRRKSYLHKLSQWMNNDL